MKVYILTHMDVDTIDELLIFNKFKAMLDCNIKKSEENAATFPYKEGKTWQLKMVEILKQFTEAELDLNNGNRHLGYYEMWSRDI